MFMAMVPAMSTLAFVQSNCEPHTSGAPPVEWYWPSSTGKTVPIAPPGLPSPHDAPPALTVDEPLTSLKTWPDAKGEPTDMEKAPAPPPERVRQTNVTLFTHPLLGVTDENEYTVALPDARSVTTTLASVSGATAWGRTDCAVGALEPTCGPNAPLRGASAPAGRLKATVHASVASDTAIPETTHRCARPSDDPDNSIRPLSPPRALARGNLPPCAASLYACPSANPAATPDERIASSARFGCPTQLILGFPVIADLDISR